MHKDSPYRREKEDSPFCPGLDDASCTARGLVSNCFCLAVKCMTRYLSIRSCLPKYQWHFDV